MKKQQDFLNLIQSHQGTSQSKFSYLIILVATLTSLFLCKWSQKVMNIQVKTIF